MSRPDSERPFAERIRPAEFSALLGQDGIWQKGKPLRELAEKDAFNALLFWGPPGTGKTTLANLIGRASGRELVILSAVQAGVKDIRAQIQRSEILKNHGEKALLMFMDEIHRLSKSQQDVLLPALEDGTIKFIGATTENPSFEVNNAILSRSLVFRFQKIGDAAMVQILKNALERDGRGEELKRVSDGVLTKIARAADGDARQALNLLDAVIQSVPEGAVIDEESLLPYLKDVPARYDKKGDFHYDIISAMIKSIRASHPDAALHYLARMIESGEDPMFIARRLVIAASEDIGNANPTALLVATAAMQSAHMVGFPEARIILAQAVTYLASSPKSNRSYLGIDQALADVRSGGDFEVPNHLRNAPTAFMKEMGYGKGYAYAHDDVEGARKLPYLPKELRGRRYYEPTDHGAERQLKEVLSRLRPTVD